MLRRKYCSVKTQALKTSVPYGSSKVEYLESSGTQHIIINDVFANQNHVVETEMSAKFHNNDEVIILFGSRNAWQQSACAVTYGLKDNLDGNTGFAQFENQVPKFISIPFHNKKVKINLSKNGLKIDEETVATFTNVQNFTSSNPYFLCTTMSNDTIDSRKMAGKIYNFNVKESDKSLVKFIPILDRTRTPCMFDLVTRKRFYNSGTGEFLYYIDNSHLLPKDYVQVEYLESTGTQWIDTKQLLKSNNFHFAIDYALLGNKGNERLIQGTNFSWVCSLASNGYGWISMPKKDSGRVGGEFNLIHNQGERIFLEFKPEVVIQNGTPLDFYGSMPLNNLTHYDSLQDTNVSLKLCSFGDPTQYTNERFAGKIFNLKLNIENNKTNFVPCLDPTGTPCMFDIVSQKAFYNNGTGDFLYPSPTSAATYSMRRPQAEYAKMTDTGVRRLYHVPIDYEGSIEEYASEHGFKLLNETESPNEEGKYYAFRWVETDTELMTEWYETEPSTDELENPVENTDEPQASAFNLRRPTPIDETVYTNNAQWAKITDTGVHKIYHTPIGYEGSLEEYAIENGYKRLIETESPNEEGKYYSFKWVETDDTLTTEWFEVEPSQEEIN